MLGKAFSIPPTPPLPTSRVSDDLAFIKVGVDFAGPLYVKNIYQSGRDDVVRAAEVVTVDNSLRQVRLKRPIQKLYPLEVNARDEDPVSVAGFSLSAGSLLKNRILGGLSHLLLGEIW